MGGKVIGIDFMEELRMGRMLTQEGKYSKQKKKMIQ